MRLLAALVLVAVLAAGCANNGNNTTTSTPPADGSNPADCTPAAHQPCAVMETSKGKIVLTLYGDKAPLSVANFVQDAQDGLYDGTVFHRIAKDPAVIQGGGFASPYSSTARPRASPNGPIPVESWTGNSHDAGTIGMARTNDPNSGTNQWFINTAANTYLNPTASNPGYTVFGKVTSGMDVVQAIAAVPVNGQTPTSDVVIQKVRVATADGPAKPELKTYHASLDVAPGGEVSTPLYVRNVGGDRLSVNLSGTGANGVTVDFPRVPGVLSDGQAGVAILRIKAPEGYTGGGVDVTASGPGGQATAHFDVKPLQASGNAAGPEHGAVQAFYLGLYDNGVTFDTTMTGLAAKGFPMPYGFQEHPQPLKVWVGSGSSPPDYTPVIPGFASGIVGLHAGETRTVRLTSDEGYHDGYFRLFEMTVKSVDS